MLSFAFNHSVKMANTLITSIWWWETEAQGVRKLPEVTYQNLKLGWQVDLKDQALNQQATLSFTFSHVILFLECPATEAPWREHNFMGTRPHAYNQQIKIHWWWEMYKFIDLCKGSREFPGSLVVKIWCFHCCGLGLIPGGELRSCKPTKSGKEAARFAEM